MERDNRGIRASDGPGGGNVRDRCLHAARATIDGDRAIARRSNGAFHGCAILETDRQSAVHREFSDFALGHLDVARIGCAERDLPVIDALNGADQSSSIIGLNHIGESCRNEHTGGDRSFDNR